MVDKGRLVRLVLAGGICLLPAAQAFANWTASGRFLYVDREYDQNGFTGNEPQLPIRLADVEIMDAKTKSRIALGSTDANGYYSIAVTDNKTRNVYARVNTQSTATSTLFVDVQQNDSGTIKWYSVATATKNNHSPSANYDFGSKVALKGSGGEAFNVFDQLVRGTDYIAFLTGNRPGASQDLSAIWASNRGNLNSFYTNSNRYIQLRDTAAYDDTPIIHEMGHYYQYQYSGSDSPGGTHTFTDCNIDLRLAFDEGYATYWGNSVFRYFGMPRCNVYMRSNGGSGPGNLVRWADLETDGQYFCQGSASEVNVFTVLWDINDSTSTTDTTQGTEDAQDALALPDAELNDVMRNYLPTASAKCLEDVWDGWFKAPISNGFRTEMLNIWRYVSVDFSEDSSEVNNSAATATPISPGGGLISLTFFYDSDGDGAGEADTDYFTFSASTGTTYRAETLSLVGDANTFLEILDSNGVTVLASNDDRSGTDSSSSIDWTPTHSGNFYIRVTHSPDVGIYGSYKLQLTQL